MKYLTLLLVLLTWHASNSQAFTGNGDAKFQVGINLQDNASGIHASYDFGVGPNISLGLSSTYALSVNDNLDADFGDRLDIRARFNANIGDVLGVDNNFDLYPGLSFGLKNFGGHVGARYFFTQGFGLYSEIGFPIAKYDTGILTAAEKIHNRFTFNIGASFNL